MSGLPRGWIEVALGRLGDWRGGGTPSKSNPGYWMNGDIPWVSPKDMKQFVIDEAEDQITASAVEESATQLIPSGSVLIVTRSGILRRILPVGVTTRDVAINQDLKALTPVDAVDPIFAGYQIQSSGQTILSECAKSGTTVDSIDFDRLKKFRFVIPPPLEQRRIVAKIDSLSAKSRRARDNIDHIPRLVEKYKQAILAAAFRGDLTQEWRQASSVAEVTHVVSSSSIGGRRRRKSVDGFTNRIGVDFPELPAGWKYKAIGSLLEEGSLVDFADGNHGSDYPRKEEFGGEGAIFVTAAQIRNGKVHFDECSLLSWNKAAKLRKGWAQSGDVLLTHNATVGRVALVEDSKDKFLLGTSVTYYRTLPNALLNRYLYWLFSSPIFQNQLSAIMGQTTRNQVPITRQAFIEIPIAPYSEQREIVRKIDAALGWIDRLTSEATKAGKLIDHLDQAVLAKAFRGELVPQDTSDEPASVLLERIRSESHVATEKKSKRTKRVAAR